MDYVKLNETRSEIRLITLLPRSFEKEIVRCRLETHSLGALSQSYSDFLASDQIPSLTKRSAILEWIALHSANDVNNRVYHDSPSEQFYRYEWGDYAALSYAWGNQSSASIVVNGCIVTVANNLESALRTFRDQGEYGTKMRLWVDAICINQNDFIERAFEVRRMKDIYGGALTVVSWLGIASIESDAALDLLHNLAGFHRMKQGNELEKLLREDYAYLGRGCWLALQNFVERAYWYRLWAIQEIVMGASSVTLKCGTATIDWMTFRDAVTILQEYLWVVKDELLRRDLSTTTTQSRRWSTWTLHLIYQDLTNLCNREERSGVRLGFGRILDIAVRSECKDARDKVYGMLALMEPRVAVRLAPDYTVNPAQVYAAAAKAFIQGYQTLEPLREANPWGPTGCPSWAADWQWVGRIRWSRIENYMPKQGFLSGSLSAPDGPLELNMEPTDCPYHASRGNPYQASFSSNGLLLTCGGFIIDTISSLSARGYGYWAWDKTTIRNNNLFRSIYGDESQLREALYRALILERVWYGRKAASRHASIFHVPSTFRAAQPQFKLLGWNWLNEQGNYYFRYERWRAANQDFWIGEHKLDDFFTDEIPGDASEYDTTESYSCIDRTCKKRRLMTTARGYIGWAPDNIHGKYEEQSREGDLIAILFGCSTPIVIRPSGRYFDVIGEAYVQGLMEGEALDLFQNEGLQSQIFTFH